jgi:hypothetical protein
MRAERYFQASFVLPLVVPWPVIFLLGRTDQFRALTWGLYYVSIIGALPYLLFLLGLLFYTRRKDAQRIQQFTLIAPLLFAVFFLCCVLIVILIQYLELGEVRIEANEVEGFCFVVLIVGYAYVLVVNVVYFILRAMGCFRVA